MTRRMVRKCVQLKKLTFLLVGISLLLFSPARADVEILWPIAAPQWGLLLNPGAMRSAEEYRSLAQRIQDESPVSLAVGIASFKGKWPEPFQMTSQLKSFKASVAARAGQALADERFLVAGHSMAGIMVQELPSHQKFGGVILMGAYPSKDVLRLGQGLRKAAIPTLILAGEWDGLTRITRVLDTVLECEGLAADHPDVKRCERQRVVVLPGVNHSDFANGELQAGDMEAELDLASAHTLIARAVAGYWTDVLVSPRSSFVSDIERDVQWRNLVGDTRQWALAWKDMDKKDAAACRDAQLKLLPPDADIRWEVEVKMVESVPGFAIARPSVEKISERHFLVTAVQTQDRPVNPLDLSLQSRAFSRLSCKLKSEESLLLAAGRVPHSSSREDKCGTLNREIYAEVQQRVMPELRMRLERRGVALSFGEDEIFNSGPQWISSKPKRQIDLQKRQAVVSVPRLITHPNAPWHLDGMHYCQFVPPTQLAEWIFFDGFKILAPSR